MFKIIKLYCSNLRNKLVSNPKFQAWASGVPLLKGFVRSDGEKIYDLMAGFVYTQTLLALVELNIFSFLKSGPLEILRLSEKVKIPADRLLILCRSAVAIGVLEQVDSKSFMLSRLGAAITGVTGLSEMIRHNRLFYQDLTDPVLLLRGDLNTNMSKFWPYVLSTEKANIDPMTAEIYSDLMLTSQKVVAQETLRIVSFSNTVKLLDVGGGTGAFLREVGKAYPKTMFCLFDLPDVVKAAGKRQQNTQEAIEIRYIGGNFINDDLPKGHDTITLIRVLYDHNDDIVIKLLRKVYEALPKGGRIVVSEPMSGGKSPTRSGDSYFGFYTMAMTTGRPRSAKDHKNFLLEAGFSNIKKLKGPQEFITQVITAYKGN